MRLFNISGRQRIADKVVRRKEKAKELFNMEKEEMTKSIRAIYPEFSIKQVERLSGGQNNEIFLVNDEWIFRFPKYAKGIDEIKNETLFLKAVHDKLPIPIPHPEYAFHGMKKPGEAFAGYRMLPGKPLQKEEFNSLKNKRAIVRELAVFMKELHGLNLSGEIHSLIGPPQKDYEIWHDLFVRLKEKVFVHMNEKARQSVAANFEAFFEEISSSYFPQTVIHGDFGPTNLLYDPVDQRLSGVIDFGSVSIGDPALELASAFFGPFGLGKEWARQVAEDYPEAADYAKRAKFYASTFALQDALFGVENGDEQAFQSGIASYQ